MGVQVGRAPRVTAAEALRVDMHRVDTQCLLGSANVSPFHIRLYVVYWVLEASKWENHIYVSPYGVSGYGISNIALRGGVRLI